MIHEAYMPVYMGSRFLARDGRTEVVQEALADLKIREIRRNVRKYQAVWIYSMYLHFVNLIGSSA